MAETHWFETTASAGVPAHSRVIEGGSMQRLWQVITTPLTVASSCGTLRLSDAWADDSQAPPKLRLPADVVAPIRCRVQLSDS